MKQYIFLLILINLVFSLHAQDSDLPDSLVQKSNVREIKVKMLKEDCNYLYYAIQNGGPETKLDWQKVSSLSKHGVESQLIKSANEAFEGDKPNYISALNYYEKVLASKNPIKWETDLANYRSALCQIELNQIEKAKEILATIKNDSRWFYQAKLLTIDLLSEEAKGPALKTFLNGPEVSGLFKIELNIMLIDRYIADNKMNEANQAFEDFKKMIPSPDKNQIMQLEEVQIKINVMNKKYEETEKLINQYIENGTVTGSMRIALGDILVGKKLKSGAVYEYLRARLDFEKTVDAEAGYKAGKLFSEMWQEDKINFSEYRNYAIKELRISLNVKSSIWNYRAKYLLDRLQ